MKFFLTTKVCIDEGLIETAFCSFEAQDNSMSRNSTIKQVIICRIFFRSLNAIEESSEKASAKREAQEFALKNREVATHGLFQELIWGISEKL